MINAIAAGIVPVCDQRFLSSLKEIGSVRLASMYAFIYIVNMFYVHLHLTSLSSILQITLVEALKVQLLEYDKKVSRRDMEVRRQERLAYVGISLNNVLPAKEQDGNRNADENEQDDGSMEESSNSESSSGSSSGDESEPIYQLRERRQAHSYRFNDYDELINSAIQVTISVDVCRKVCLLICYVSV